MASGHASTSYSSTLTGTVADLVTIDQLWATLKVTNRDTTDTVWVHQDGTTNPTPATPAGPGCISIAPLTSEIIATMPTLQNTLAVSIVGNDGGYTIAGVGSIDSADASVLEVLNQQFVSRSGDMFFDPTDGAASGSDVTTSFQAAVDAAGLLGGIVQFPAGEWDISSKVTASLPVTIAGPENAILDFTGTGIGLQMGPDGLVFGTLHSQPYTIRGLTFTGGSSLTTAGIRFNKYIIQPRLLNVGFKDFCAGAGIYNVEFYDENWDIFVWGANIYVTPGNVVKWLNVNAAGGINSSRLRHISSHVHSDHTAGVGIRVNGANSLIAHSKIEGWGQPIILGPLATDSRVIDSYGEVIAASGGGWITYGLSAVLDGLIVERNYVNLHKSDINRDVSVLVPGDATAGLKNAVIRGNSFVNQGTAPIVKMNTAVAGQVPNFADTNKGYTGTFVTPAVTGGGSKWAGTEGGKLIDPNWIPVAGGVGFQNSWANAGGHPVAAYRLTPDGRHVELIGGVNSGASGTIVFTLPAGYQPATLIGLVQGNFSTLTSQVITIDTAGNVKIFGGVAANNQRIDGVFALDGS